MSAPPLPGEVVYVTAQAIPSGGLPLPPEANPIGTANTNAFCNEIGAREYLAGKKWPLGLQNTSVANLAKIPIRFFICDDSGSMILSDGHKLMSTSTGVQKYVACLRNTLILFLNDFIFNCL